MEANLSNFAKRVTDFLTMAMSNKALEIRINRTVAPALAILNRFKLTKLLKNKLLGHATKLFEARSGKSRLKRLLRYMDCVDQLKVTIESIGRDGKPAIQKLQEVVKFLSQTKVMDLFLTEPLKVVYEMEKRKMRSWVL